MRINVAQQLKQPVGITRLYKVSETEKTTVRKVKGELKLTRTDKGILVTGELETVQSLTCSRCLGKFDHPLTLIISEEYVPTHDINSDTALPVPEGVFTIDANHEICLDDAQNQYTLMSKPMKPLCRADCRGLCDQCGVNLNNGDCGCSKAGDPRWAALAGLRHDE